MNICKMNIWKINIWKMNIWKMNIWKMNICKLFPWGNSRISRLRLPCKHVTNAMYIAYGTSAFICMKPCILFFSYQKGKLIKCNYKMLNIFLNKLVRVLLRKKIFSPHRTLCCLFDSQFYNILWPCKLQSSLRILPWVLYILLECNKLRCTIWSQ